jgi:hypothetical protein
VKKLTAVCLLLTAALPAVAVEGDQALYVGGTIPGLNAGVLGHVDTTSSATLIFEHAGGKVAIPYADITSYEYSKDVTHHLGVLPAAAVGLLKMRRHSHFFRITYRDPGGAFQTIVFEVPKGMPRVLEAVLDARAPHTRVTACSSGCSYH